MSASARSSSAARETTIRGRRFSAVLFAACLALAAHAAPAAAQTQLLPDFDNPKLGFGTGKVVGNKPQISDVYPDIPGPPSPWWVTQWTQPILLSGDQMTRNDPATADPAFGPAAYGFTAADGHSHVWIYMNGQDGHPVYDLYERGGTLSNGGGANIYLATGVKPPVSFDHQIHFSMLAGISNAVASYDTPAAKKTGAVMGMAYMSYVVQFPSPAGGATSTLFMQVALANSFPNAKFHVSCVMRKNGSLMLMTGGTLSGQAPLPFTPNPGRLVPVAYDVNDYITRTFARTANCQEKGAGVQPVDLAQVPASSILLKSVYVGLETQNTDKRPGAAMAAPQGQMEMGLQLSNLTLTSSQ
jgi:hypothetical protein